MTDNDIIKALECCKTDYSGCLDCPLYEHRIIVCEAILNYHTIKLINRQKAEIEELKEDNKQFANHLVERGDFIEKVRAEAIKEFAERFLEIVHNNHYLLRTNLNSTDYGMFTLGIEQALNEAKEMVGERE